MNRIVDFYESNHLLILMILIVVFALYIKSIKKNNHFSKTENIIEDENDDFDKLIKTGSEVKLNYILTGEIITLVISQNQSKKYKNKSEIRRLYFKSTLAEALNDKKAGDIIKFKVDELKEEYTYVEILDVNNEIFTKEEIESFKEIQLSENECNGELKKQKLILNEIPEFKSNLDLNVNPESPNLTKIKTTNIINMITYERTRFYVNQIIYEQLINTEKPNLKIIVNPNDGNHPRGTYNIPNNIAIQFIREKQKYQNWDDYQNFNQDSIPVPLLEYFTYR